MDNSLLQELFMTKDPAEKAAIIAEYFFSALPEKTIRVARQCILFHWFNASIIEALFQETSLTEDEKSEACKQLVSLPFIETLPWGYRFQNLTREGLLKRYVLTQPELLQKAAHLAAPAYKAREDDKRMAAEALFCYMVTGNQPLSIYLLDKLREEASSQEDWYSISNLLQLQDEAEQLPLVQPLPRTEQDWLLRGLVHRAQGKLEIAIADCSNAILINSESALAYVSRGSLYVEQQDDEQALTDYGLALHFDPTMTQAYINRGIVYKNRKRFSEALQDFDSALQLDPNNAFVYCNKGSILNELGQHKEALAAYEEALCIDPDSEEAYYGRVQVLHDMSVQEGEQTNIQTQESSITSPLGLPNLLTSNTGISVEKGSNPVSGSNCSNESIFDIVPHFNQQVIKDIQMRALNTPASINLWIKGFLSRIIKQQVLPSLEVNTYLFSEEQSSSGPRSGAVSGTDHMKISSVNARSCQALSDSKKWQDHDEEDTILHIDALTGIAYISDESEFEYRLGLNESNAVYRRPFDKIDTFQRRPPYMSVFRKVWLIPIPFCIATFLSSALWNLSQMTSAWFLGEVTAIIALVLALLLPRLIAPIIHKPLLDFKQKLVSLPLIIGSAMFAGWIWLIVASNYLMISRWDLCWWCALIGITCGMIAYL